ncbi:MAG: AIPR family protein [Chloroflexi bacterium]|nr:AIPR family protein [Chloroflexota bacterium]
MEASEVTKTSITTLKNTATYEPDMFWVFNNGVTALVNNFEYTSEDDPGFLEISGIAIVNGAQTTGAIGTLDNVDLSNAFVPARFVKCSDPVTIRDIIRFNNSQEKLKLQIFAAMTQFNQGFGLISSMPDVEYSGGRRGSAEDVVRRPRNSISSYSVGQALMAFHADPVTAYNLRSKIWQDDSLYSRIFNENLSAAHALCAYALLKAVDEAKSELRAIGDDQRTDSQTRYLEVFRQRGATFLLTAAIAGLETILSRPITSKFSIRFRRNYSVIEAIHIWQPIVDLTIPLITRLTPAFSSGNIKSRDTVLSAINDFVDMLEAIKGPNSTILKHFRAHCIKCFRFIDWCNRAYGLSAATGRPDRATKSMPHSQH